MKDIIANSIFLGWVFNVALFAWTGFNLYTAVKFKFVRSVYLTIISRESQPILFYFGVVFWLAIFTISLLGVSELAHESIINLPISGNR